MRLCCNSMLILQQRLLQLLAATTLLFAVDQQAAHAQSDVCSASLPETPPSDTTVIIGSTANLKEGSFWCDPLETDVYDGLFYKVRGTGNTMAATTCAPGITNYVSDIAITADCSMSECMYDSIFYPTTGCVGDNVNFETKYWDSLLDQFYYVFVSSADAFDTGTFGLKILDFPTPANAVCNDAILLSPNGASVEGYTIGSGLTPWCGDSAANADKYSGVWYKVVGTGRPFLASTCSEKTNYNPDIAILASTNNGLCPTMTKSPCVAEDSTLTQICKEEYGTTIGFQTEAGLVYYLFVSGESKFDSGNFAFSIEEIVAPSNNFCTALIPTLPKDGSETQGTTIGAVDVPYCTDAEDTYPSAFYSVVGTGNLMAVSSCTMTTNFRTHISVQTDCNTGGCVTTSKAICDRAGQGYGMAISFPTQAGRNYKIQVTGFTYGVVGYFGLVVQDGLYEESRVNTCIAVVTGKCTCADKPSCFGKTMKTDCKLSMIKSIFKQERKAVIKASKAQYNASCRSKKRSIAKRNGRKALRRQ